MVPWVPDELLGAAEIRGHSLRRCLSVLPDAGTDALAAGLQSPPFRATHNPPPGLGLSSCFPGDQCLGIQWTAACAVPSPNSQSHTGGLLTAALAQCPLASQHRLEFLRPEANPSTEQEAGIGGQEEATPERPSTSLGFTDKQPTGRLKSWDLNLSQDFSRGQLNMPAASGRSADLSQRKNKNRNTVAYVQVALPDPQLRVELSRLPPSSVEHF